MLAPPRISTFVQEAHAQSNLEFRKARRSHGDVMAAPRARCSPNCELHDEGTPVAFSAPSLASMQRPTLREGGARRAPFSGAPKTENKVVRSVVSVPR